MSTTAFSPDETGTPVKRKSQVDLYLELIAEAYPDDRLDLHRQVAERLEREGTLAKQIASVKRTLNKKPLRGERKGGEKAARLKSVASPLSALVEPTSEYSPSSCPATGTVWRRVADKKPFVVLGPIWMKILRQRQGSVSVWRIGVEYVEAGSLSRASYCRQLDDFLEAFHA